VKATAGRPLPITPWLRGYDRAWLVRDLIGGLAAGAVVIPQAMAYATLADLPAQVGLYTCMVPMAVYALLGGSRTLSVSTTSTVAILTGSTLLAPASPPAATIRPAPWPP
jgi:sulfate permease, SulP family